MLESMSFIHTDKRREDTNEPRWGGKEYIQKKWEVVDILECRNGYKK